MIVAGGCAAVVIAAGRSGVATIAAGRDVAAADVGRKKHGRACSRGCDYRGRGYGASLMDQKWR